ncbi:unnamed protein product [Gadus morhua 'NCC']
MFSTRRRSEEKGQARGNSLTSAAPGFKLPGCLSRCGRHAFGEKDEVNHPGHMSTQLTPSDSASRALQPCNQRLLQDSSPCLRAGATEQRKPPLQSSQGQSACVEHERYDAGTRRCSLLFPDASCVNVPTGPVNLNMNQSR